ncbi:MULTISPECIES: DUF397 domain-containing protein [Streptomyces]|uniref:DUF397 domain-containing protein n=1 Tax=Streptomyces TaxID=1883 RepID=UPI002780EF3E|nr:DUF397 domain-containing protein [Streptomyces achromogenes]MDQ0831198.1 hypothetical protein [Streptomyces achromogenes]
MTSPSPHEWFKSSYSGGSGTECVECVQREDGTLVRDSKQESGPLIAVQHRAWLAFLRALQRGNWA